MESLTLSYTEDERRIEDHPSDPLASDSNLNSKEGIMYKQVKGKESRKQGQPSQWSSSVAAVKPKCTQLGTSLHKQFTIQNHSIQIIFEILGVN